MPESGNAADDTCERMLAGVSGTAALRRGHADEGKLAPLTHQGRRCRINGAAATIPFSVTHLKQSRRRRHV